VDAEILDCLAAHGVMSVGDLCEEIGVSEGEMIAFLAMLARQGRVRISQVELAA
jgi:DNA-binding IclR family transcriptional regulator